MEDLFLRISELANANPLGITRHIVITRVDGKLVTENDLKTAREWIKNNLKFSELDDNYIATEVRI